MQKRKNMWRRIVSVLCLLAFAVGFCPLGGEMSARAEAVEVVLPDAFVGEAYEADLMNRNLPGTPALELKQGSGLPQGLTLSIEGDTNDYFGKGLSGGKLIVKAPKEAAYQPWNNVLAGNVALYGATSGKAFIAGMAGERFCIRNSGATAVVEGVGEHGCEYMTGGMAVILGPTGKNFAAGMSGGVAYVLDEDNKLYRNLNKDLVEMETFSHKNDVMELKNIIMEHVEATDSEKGRNILDHFDEYIPRFKKIIPVDYREILHLIARKEEQGMSRDMAQIEAFSAFVENVEGEE